MLSILNLLGDYFSQRDFGGVIPYLAIKWRLGNDRIRGTDGHGDQEMEDEECANPSYSLYLAGKTSLESGDLDAAIKHFESSVAQDPHFKALELLGESWLRKGEPKRAIVPLAAATTLNAQVRAPSLRAEALLALGNDLDAHRMALLALDRDPNNKRARTVLEITDMAHKKWSDE
jgi:tetratricopeptide (TPR) repeat protein